MIWIIGTSYLKIQVCWKSELVVIKNLSRKKDFNWGRQVRFCTPTDFEDLTFQNMMWTFLAHKNIYFSGKGIFIYMTLIWVYNRWIFAISRRGKCGFEIGFNKNYGFYWTWAHNTFIYRYIKANSSWESCKFWHRILSNGEILTHDRARSDSVHILRVLIFNFLLTFVKKFIETFAETLAYVPGQLRLILCYLFL